MSEKTPKDTKKPTVSAFRNAAELEAKERRAAEQAERERQAAEEEAAYQAREEYAKGLNEEKVDLIRLKQGVITDSDKVFPEQEPEKKYTVWQKISNWLYCAQWWLGIAAFCVVVFGFLLYDSLTRVDPDQRILILSNHAELYAHTDRVHNLLATACTDLNGDDKVIASSIYVPVSKETMESGGSYAASYNSQLLIQFQTATCMLVIADDAANAYLEPETAFVDLETVFPEYDCVDGYRIRLDQTKFAELLELETPLNEGCYLAIRAVQNNMSGTEEMQAAYDQAMPILEAFLEILTEGAVTDG